MRAHRYHRFSSKVQDKGSSLDRQEDATRSLCERKGWEVIETLQDLGRSAWNGDHLRVGELGKFKARIDAGEIGAGAVLVIENLDRLSRQDVKRARRWIEEVTDAGVQVAVCNPEKVFNEASLSGENIVDLLQYLLEAQRSTVESERKSTMLRAAWARNRELAKNGHVITRRVPGWLEVRGGKMVVLEERAEIVRQVYRWSAEGLGACGICKKLNGQGLESWGRNHHKRAVRDWRPGYIRDLLSSPAVEGEYHPQLADGQKTGDLIEGYFPRIVDAELVVRARSARARRSKTGGPNHAEARNLFTGRTRCAHCRNTMVRIVQRNRSRKLYEYFKCLSYQNGSPCPNRTLYDYTAFERDALEQILHLALDDTHFSRTNETAGLVVDLAKAEKAVEVKRQQLRRLIVLAMTLDDVPEVEVQLRATKGELTELEGARDECQEALAQARGAVSPEEHLRRVIEVRDAIYSEDEETRTRARRKVRDAISSIVTLVECRMDDPYADAGKTVTMILAGGYMAFKFAHRGGLLGKIDLHNSRPLQRGVRGTGGEQAMADIKRRRGTSGGARAA